MAINLELSLRVCEVKRWTVVHLSAPQSVAEHQYRVWLLAMAMYSALEDLPHNTSERAMVEMMALSHDIQEVITGDIPSTFKRISDATHPGVVDTMEGMARTHMGWPPMGAHVNTAGGRIVKIADYAESLLFLHQNGGHNRPAVWNSNVAGYKDCIESAAKAYPSLNWARVHAVLGKAAISDESWVSYFRGISPNV